MICHDCKGNKCLNMIHEDKTAEAMGPSCPFCNDTLLVADHQACIERNKDKVPADCDCQHRPDARNLNDAIIQG